MKQRIERKNALQCLFVLLLIASPVLQAGSQAPAPPVGCGKTKIRLEHPLYLTSSVGIVAAELPQGWALEESKSNPFYFLKSGERYSSARTLMYVNVERLQTHLQTAVQADARTFSESCQPSRIRDVTAPDILEQGCEKTTQMFSCDKEKDAYVDLVTKISVGGLLLNVVLSADNEAEISRYRKDYEYLLKHIALVR